MVLTFFLLVLAAFGLFVYRAEKTFSPTACVDCFSYNSFKNGKQALFLLSKKYI